MILAMFPPMSTCLLLPMDLFCILIFPGSDIMLGRHYKLVCLCLESVSDGLDYFYSNTFCIWCVMFKGCREILMSRGTINLRKMLREPGAAA